MDSHDNPNLPPHRRKRNNVSGRSKSGCLTCRTKRVKCDESLPSCRRCQRLNLKCRQPCSRMLPRLPEKCRGTVPLEVQETVRSSSSLVPLLPRHEVMETNQVNDEGPIYDEDSDMPSARINMQNSYNAFQSTTQNFQEITSWFDPPTQAVQLPVPTLGRDFDVERLFPIPQIFKDPFRWEAGSGAVQPPILLSAPYVVSMIPENIKLDADEKQAISHFATVFSLSQTTRDPQWSTPTLLLRNALQKSRMLLHSILAVSLIDLTVRRIGSTRMRQVAQQHYELGTQQLIQALQSEACSDHLGVLGTFYCIYTFMSQQQVISCAKIDRLSITTLNHIIKHDLDSVSVSMNTSSTGSETLVEYSEQSLLARLTMWLLKLDAQCSFFGCKSSLAEYFEGRFEQLNSIQGLSRIALQLNWGAEYPISQSIRDIESCLPVDMLMDLSFVLYQISAVHEMAEEIRGEKYEAIKKRLEYLEVKYASVFYYGSSNMTLQPAMKVNCATSATMFYALGIYLAGSVSESFGTEDNSSTQHSLGRLLVFAQHACPAVAQQPLYEFQWSLFIASIESDDAINQEWMRSRISDSRFSKVLQRVLVMKATTPWISLHILKRMLRGAN